MDGYDEAIFLTSDGHVSEGSAENIFIVRNGALITPPITDDILEGITRQTVMELAREELNIEVVERRIDRTELYIAEEAFFVGTGAQVSYIAEIDGRTDRRWQHRADQSANPTPIFRCRPRDVYRNTATGANRSTWPKCRRINERSFTFMSRAKTKLNAHSHRDALRKRRARSLKLLEYQAKELFAAEGIPTLKGQVAETADAVRAAAESLGGRVVVKAQFPIGGRAKPAALQ